MTPRPVRYRGGYRVNFRDKNDVRHRRKFSDHRYKDSLTACREYIADAMEGKLRQKPVEIAPLFADYIRHVEKTHAKAWSTIETDRRRLYTFAKWCRDQGGVKLTTDLTVGAIRRFERFFWDKGTWYPDSGSGRAVGNRGATWNRYFNCISTFARWAVENGYLKENPAAARSQFLRPEQEKPIERVYSLDELHKVFDWLDREKSPAEACFYRLLAYTGMRPSEALRLQWKAVNLKARVIIVSQTKNRRVRTIPIHPDLAPRLEKIRSNRDLVFHDNNGDPLHRIWWWGRLWAKALEGAGVEPGRLYDVRHSFATTLIENSVPLTDVKELLGHRRIETTVRYLHTRPERLREAVVNLYKPPKKGGKA